MNLHFMVGLLLEYLDKDQRHMVQMYANQIQEVYDLGREDTEEGLTTILENVRKVIPLLPDSYHRDLASLIVRTLEVKERLEG